MFDVSTRNAAHLRSGAHEVRNLRFLSSTRSQKQLPQKVHLRLFSKQVGTQLVKSR